MGRAVLPPDRSRWSRTQLCLATATRRAKSYIDLRPPRPAHIAESSWRNWLGRWQRSCSAVGSGATNVRYPSLSELFLSTDASFLGKSGHRADATDPLSRRCDFSALVVNGKVTILFYEVLRWGTP